MNPSIRASSTGTGQLGGSRDALLDTTVLQPSTADSAFGALGRWISNTYELSDSSGRLRSMEGLRGFAVLLVYFVHFHALFSHYVKQTPLLWRVSSFIGNVGNAGVDLFFVLSGYLIYKELVQHKITFSRYLVRRAVRIYPTFLAIFVLYLALSIAFPENSKLHGYGPAALVVYVTQNLLLLPGIAPIAPIITVSWSLSYEVVFYLSAAALIYGVRLWNWSSATRVALMLFIFISYVVFCFSVHQAHVRVLMFIVGVLLYEALSSGGFHRLFSRRSEVLVIFAFFLGFAYSYLLDVRPEFFSSLPGWNAGRSVQVGVPGYQGPYKTIVLGLIMFWFVGYCLALDGRLMRTFLVAPLRYLGNMSYSYYLVHGLALQALALLWALIWPKNTPSTAAFTSALFAGFALAWIASTGLFLLVEKPLSLKRPSRSLSLARVNHD